jgi:hypothetical protein
LVLINMKALFMSMCFKATYIHNLEIKKLWNIKKVTAG